MPEIYIPGSKDPFRPLNPWGRPMPKPVRGPRPDLYQLIVRRHGKEIPYGPKMEKGGLDELLHTIEAAIRVGVEKEITEPHLVRCVSEA
jgi:hypothetical protein